MLLEKLDPATMQGRKDYMVGMDTVGAGPGDLVQRIALGTHSKDSVDYPDIAVQVARKVAAGDCERGIMIDGAGTGSGIAIVTRSSAKY
jgi:hypothetical protein